jgi:hypothetical protein
MRLPAEHKAGKASNTSLKIIVIGLFFGGRIGGKFTN